jgi:putative membrane protein
MASEIRRLHPLSWLFITATSVKGLILPVIIVLFASGGNLAARYELLSLLVVGPAFVAALLKQGIYNYRFTDEELVVRDGILTKKERHIPYDRVHNIALVRNPFHRMLGVASARVETAAGGEAEAVMRVLTLDAVDELRRYTLRKERAVAPVAGAGTEAAGAIAAGHASGEMSAEGAAIADTADQVAGVTSLTPSVLLSLRPGELVRLGLISNRGFIVVAAFFGLVSQANWWDRDWEAYYGTVRERAPAWTTWLLEPGSLTARILLGVALVLLFVVLLRLFSVAWYVVRYYDFTVQREDEDLRTEFGLLTRVSSLIPVHRIQLLTSSASLLHRLFGRAGIDVETAGAVASGGSGLGDQLAASGANASRQWLAPVIVADRAPALIRKLMPETDLDAVEWEPLAPRAARRILKKSVLLIALLTGAIMAPLSLTRIPVSGWHALWLPAFTLPLIYFGVTAWVRNAGYALTDHAVFFRSGWLARKISVVRFNKMQTVWMRESPFDRRHHMASVAVDTAGAGKTGHRVNIPYLNVEVARGMSQRLYAEARATEFRW